MPQSQKKIGKIQHFQDGKKIIKENYTDTVVIGGSLEFA